MTLIAASFLLLNALTFSNVTHWSADNIWLVDWLALAFHILALVLTLHAQEQSAA